MRTRIVAALFGASVLAFASQAVAAISSGSGALVSVRDCAAPTGSCFGGGVVRGGAGGALAGGATSISTLGGSTASASMSFPSGYLPELGLYTKAGGTQRAFAEAAAFSTFTYTGTVAIDLAMIMNYHYITTGSAGPTTGDPALEVPGDSTGIVGAGIASTSLYSDLTTVSTATDIFDALSLRGSDLGFGYYATTGTTGEQNIPIQVLDFSGMGVRINPGDTFIVAAIMQAVSNRGGLMDAAHTLTLQFDSEHTYLAGTRTVVGDALFTQLSPVTPVPEPDTWALTLIGIGAVGAVLRARGRFRAVGMPA
jgi:hypothetical protein